MNFFFPNRVERHRSPSPYSAGGGGLVVEPPTKFSKFLERDWRQRGAGLFEGVPFLHEK